MREFLKIWAPAIAQGVAQGLLNSANPANVLLAPYYKVLLTYQLTSFALREALYYAAYMQLKDTDLAAANKALDACSEPFKNLSTTWSSLDKAQKIEMISQIVTEIIAGPKATKIFDKFMKSVTEETALASSRVLKGLVGEKTPAKMLATNLLQELRCEASELAKKYNLDTSDLNRQIDKIARGEIDITHIKRNFKFNGLEVQMKSGHAYFREHLGGDLRRIGNLNEIEEAIIQDAYDSMNLTMLKSAKVNFDAGLMVTKLNMNPLKKETFLVLITTPRFNKNRVLHK